MGITAVRVIREKEGCCLSIAQCINRLTGDAVMS